MSEGENTPIDNNNDKDEDFEYLKQLDSIPNEANKLISPFIKRGKELNKIQPLISYYCYLYAAQLILESKLHLQNTEIANYIEILLNYIESIKKSIESNNLTEFLNDKEKSFKLILGFSLTIFNKSFDEINNHQASIQTVVNFKIFLNFIQVLNLWPDLYKINFENFHKQIKYAKFHSSRILKDIKLNKDPNDYITAQDESDLSILLNDESIDNSNNDINLPNTPSEISGDLNLPTAPVLIKGQKNSLGLPSTPNDDNDDKLSITPPPIPSKPSIPSIQSQAPIQSQQESKILSKQEVEKIWSQSDIISNAQRKAKFAISALNYDDIETAITELQGALSLLRGE